MKEKVIQGKQIGKGNLQIIYVEKPKDLVEEIMKTVQQSDRIQNQQKQVIFLYADNELKDKGIKNSILYNHTKKIN